MSEQLTQYPRVGVAVWLKDAEGKVLMMKRLGSHGGGTWAPPGGKFEMGEEFLDCAKREVKEETGIDIDGMEFVGATNDIFSPEKHYVTLHFKAVSWTGEPKIMEPEKCSEIGWYDIHSLPEPQFLSDAHLLESEFPCLCGSGKSFKGCGGK